MTQHNGILKIKPAMSDEENGSEGKMSTGRNKSVRAVPYKPPAFIESNVLACFVTPSRIFYIVTIIGDRGQNSDSKNTKVNCGVKVFLETAHKLENIHLL